MRRDRHIRAVAGVALFWLASCDPLAPPNLVGVTKSAEAGAVEVAYAGCPAELVKSVEIVRLSGNVVGDADDPVLWHITSTEGSTDSLYVAGQTPPGFKEEVPLSGSLPSRTRLAAVVESNLSAGAFEEFTLGDLQVGQVLTDEGYVALRDFMQQTPPDCPH